MPASAPTHGTGRASIDASSSRQSPSAGAGLGAWLFVIASIATASLLCWSVDRHLSLTVQAAVYLVTVVIVAYRCDRAQSATAALLSVLALNLLFVPPRGTLSVDSAEHLLTLGPFLVVALLISHLAARLRRETADAHARERRALQLQGLAGELAALSDAADPPDEGRIDDAGDIGRVGFGQRAVRPAMLRLEQACGAPVLLAIRQPDGRLADVAGTLLPVDLPQRAALQHCMDDGRVLGPGTDRWPDLPAWYLPLRDGTQVLAAVEWPVAEGARIDDETRQHAQAMCDLLSAALQRTRQAEQAFVARSQAQLEQQRSALLAAVSHDFRTPLASIVGAASSLQEQRERLTEADRERLVALIAQEADYLVTMTENTLQWARLSSAQREVQRDWQSLEEIIGTALARVRRRDPLRRVHAHVPAALPLVRADPVMLAQLLDNLLDNALKYSDGAVEIDAAFDGCVLRVAVNDRGPGPGTLAGKRGHDADRIFESFVRGASSAGVRGSGLGLAVCRAIAEAHGGSLVAQARVGGGSSFVLSLVAEEPPLVPVEAVGE
ncbi:hypothetical protein BH11PSE8_BH11PSE8_35080 [soil metagenome]